ncbi:MAG TPA: hypothetical protein VGK73_38290, partial [Polyangiaceae bacterium]
CCQRIEQRGAAVPGVHDAAARLPSPPLATATPWFDLVADFTPAVRIPQRVQARAPPYSGPPLFLKHCALLS